MSGASGRLPEPALWRIIGPDILDRHREEQLKLADLLSAWLEQFRQPFSLWVCSRRETSTPPAPASPRAEVAVRLEAALKAAAWEREERFRRRVYLAQWGSGPAIPIPPPPLEARRLAWSSVTRLAEGPRTEFPLEMQVGGKWTQSLWLQRLPGTEVGPGWLWALLGAAYEYDLALQVWPRSRRQADLQLRRRLRGLRARQLAGSDRGEIDDPHLAAAMEGAVRLRQTLASSRGQLFELAISLTLVAATARQARRLGEEARLGLAGLRGSLVPAWCDQSGSADRTSLRDPGRPGHARVVQSRELASCWPWLDDWQGRTRSRARLGIHLRTGSPIWLELGEGDDLPNSNIGVVAASGSGKSYLGGLLGLEAVRLGVKTVVIDPENEHGNWCQAVGGDVMRLGEQLETGFNLLELVERQEAPAAVVELLQLLWGEMESAEVLCLTEAVGRTLAQARGRAPARLEDCVPVLRESHMGAALAARLEPWLEGPAGALFNQAGRGPVVSTVVSIGLRELPPAWVPATVLLLSRWLWSWIREQPGRKQAIVDEAGLLSDNPPLQRLMAQLARRIRKYQGSLVLLTQSAGDLLATEPGEVMAVNSATMLLGSQHPAAAHRLQVAFQLDEEESRWLERAGRGEFLLLRGSRRSPIRIEAPDLQHRLLTGRGGCSPGGELAGPGGASAAL